MHDQTPHFEADEPHPYALFLDFDGTLVDIAPRPDASSSIPSPRLQRLRDRLGGALAIVTGRPVGVIDAELAPAKFDVAGLHGAEMRLASSSMEVTSPSAALRDCVARLQSAVAAKPGLLVEDKFRSVALHWRLVPHLADEAVALLSAEAERLGRPFGFRPARAFWNCCPPARIRATRLQSCSGNHPIAVAFQFSSGMTSLTNMDLRSSMPPVGFRSGSGRGRLALPGASPRPET